MGRTDIVTTEFKGDENTAYHDIIALFKIYRSVNWRMQIKINQVKHRFRMEIRNKRCSYFRDGLYACRKAASRNGSCCFRNGNFAWLRSGNFEEGEKSEGVPGVQGIYYSLIKTGRI